jgi:hypothetical protein
MSEKTLTDDIVLERTDMNFYFRYPNGAKEAANMTQVLLWEILRKINTETMLVTKENIYTR